MIIVDLNVIVYAYNAANERHIEARNWWNAALRGHEEVGIAWTEILGFLRLSTKPRVMKEPLSAEEALAEVNDWILDPNVTIVRETEGHWRTLCELLAGTGFGGDLTSDAHLAALAICHGASLVSYDRDFDRFDGLHASALGINLEDTILTACHDKFKW